MPALLSVWIGLASLLFAGVMLAYRPALTDLTVTLVLYFGSPGALCLGGLVLWAHRKKTSTDPAVRAQRLQARVAIALALAAITIVYLLLAFSEKVERFEG